MIITRHLLKYFLFVCLFSSFNHVANIIFISNTIQIHRVCDKAKKTTQNSPFLANLGYLISSHSATFNKIYYFVHRENKEQCGIQIRVFTVCLSVIRVRNYNASFNLRKT